MATGESTFVSYSVYDIRTILLIFMCLDIFEPLGGDHYTDVLIYIRLAIVN